MKEKKLVPINTHAEVCPVCKGEGNVFKPPQTPTSVRSVFRQCQGCGGSGWVILPNKIEE